MLVLDASAGVKWFHDEAGSDMAPGLLVADIASDGVWMPDNCAHEVLAVIHRRAGWGVMAAAWRAMVDASITIVAADEALVLEAARVGAELDCTYCDALAPAVARLIDATLVSADARAHAAVPGVLLIG